MRRMAETEVLLDVNLELAALQLRSSGQLPCAELTRYNVRVCPILGTYVHVGS